MLTLLPWGVGERVSFKKLRRVWEITFYNSIVHCSHDTNLGQVTVLLSRQTVHFRANIAILKKDYLGYKKSWGEGKGKGGVASRTAPLFTREHGRYCFINYFQENMRGQRGTLPVHALWYVIVTKVIYRLAHKRKYVFRDVSIKTKVSA